jgi:diguanylate cyclase (GGDEF)-like protein
MSASITRSLSESLPPSDMNRLPVIPATASLKSMLETWDVQHYRHLLVENPEGVIDGLISVQEVLRRVSAENSVERSRWEHATVASLTESVLATGAQTTHTASLNAEDLRSDVVPVIDRYGCAALVSQGEVYVSWDRVCQAISQNQIDPVTLLPMRLSFNRRLAEEMDRAARTQRSIAVVMIDLDHFKTINDRFGHSTGDMALRTVARSLREGIRSYDFVARFGGDEFAVICTDCKPDSIDLPIARLVQDMARQPPVDEATQTRISLSIGAAVMAEVDSHCSLDVVFEQADACLYQAKRTGRNRAVAVALDPFGLPLSAPRELPGSHGVGVGG